MPSLGPSGSASRQWRESPQGFQGVQCWVLLPSLPATRDAVCSAICMAVVVRGHLRWEGFEWMSADYERAAISALLERLSGGPPSSRFHWHREDQPMGLAALATYTPLQLRAFFPYTIRDLCHG